MVLTVMVDTIFIKARDVYIFMPTEGPLLKNSYYSVSLDQVKYNFMYERYLNVVTRINSRNKMMR